MSQEINQNVEPLFIFEMPDDELLANTISVQGEKGERGDPTKTSQLTNDSDFTTNAALNAGLATKADATTVQSLASQVSNNTAAIANINLKNIAILETRIGDNVWWYKIAKLMPIASLENSGSIRIHGKINGLTSSKPVLVDVAIMNRNDGVKAVGTVQAIADWDNADFVVFQDTETTEATLYLKLTGWNTVDFDISYVDCTYEYDGTHVTTTPSGTLVWSLKNDNSLQQNIAGVVNVDITGDAATVNGYNVYKSVPSTAKFTDTVYDDSTIRAELDEKADAATVAANYATKAEMQSIANGAPIPVSSTSAMTDTSKIYLLTTNGYWYYYNGSSWAQGGVYQSTGLADGSVTPKKTSFNKTSRNLYDWESATVLNAYCVGTAGFIANASTRTTYIACEPNTTYTVSKTLSQRFAVATSATEPAAGVPAIAVNQQNTATSITITTPANAAYLAVFYYHANYDTTVTEADIRKTIMIEKAASAGTFVEHKIIEVTNDNLNSACVTRDKLASDVIGAIAQTDRLRSRNKIYGVQFDITATSPTCTRIADADGLHNDYVVGSAYQLNGGVNDFDNIFPWCDMRRCNLSFDENGKKRITYEGESGFALDGSNGNVMVEIPKFYSMRERIGNIETWAITGEPKSGFNVEPAFVVDGVEQDFVYVGAYNASDLLDGSYYSYSGTLPTTKKTLSSFISDFSAVRLQSYDLSIFLMLQKLVTIEFGTRNAQQYMGGISSLPYNYSTAPFAITGAGTNYVVVSNSQERLASLWVGERVQIGAGEGSYANSRNITSITEGTDSRTIYYDGDDLTDSLIIGTSLLTASQQLNGLTDGLSYHTGRTNHGAGTPRENYVNPMRYRYIENLWGNVWERIAGFRVKDLKYYYSFIPNYNADIASTDNEWLNVNYDAPMQPSLGETDNAWIVKQGYDCNSRLINLPTVVGSANGGGNNKYFSDCFYSKNETTATEYTAVVGSGWDHYIYGGVFTLRAYLALNNSEWLYGNRPIYRG